MFKKLISSILIVACLASYSIGQESNDNLKIPEKKWQKYLLAGSCALFINGIIMFVIADNIENKIETTRSSAKKESYAKQANIYWTLTLISFGGATACGLWALRMQFEPQIITTKLTPFKVALQYQF